MECKYKFIKEDVNSFTPKYNSICTRCASKPPFPECDEDSCTYFQEKLEEELRKNPPLRPGWRHCPFMPPNWECNIYLNNCSTCSFNPAVKERREKERAEQKRLKEESKLSYKIKKLFKKEFEADDRR